MKHEWQVAVYEDGRAVIRDTVESKEATFFDIELGVAKLVEVMDSGVGGTIEEINERIKDKARMTVGIQIPGEED